MRARGPGAGVPGPAYVRPVDSGSPTVPRPDASQRWHWRRHSWRRPADGPFRPSRYDVAACDETTTKAFVTGHHYSASYPAAARRFGLYDGSALVGAAVYGIPVSRAVLSNVFPQLDPYRQSLELSRFVLLDEVPANAESWFLARCHELLAADGVRGVVAFSDPVERRTPAGIVHPGHWGCIYQASNARHLGRGTPRSLVLLPDGTALSARSAQKVRRLERGHRHVEQRLVALGATARADDDPARWLAGALDDVGARRVRHPGCLRYAFVLGTPAERRRVVVGGTPLPYPKSAALVRVPDR